MVMKQETAIVKLKTAIAKRVVPTVVVIIGLIVAYVPHTSYLFRS